MVGYLIFIIKCIITYLISPIVIFSLFVKFLKLPKFDIAILVLSLIIGPLLNVWLFSLTIRFFPHQSNGFYISLVSAPLLLGGVYFFATKGWIRLKDILRKLPAILRPLNNDDKLLMCSTLGLMSLILIMYVITPLTENDPLEYFYIAKLIVSGKSLGFYPNTAGLESNGLLAPFTHPIGFPAFLAWNMLGLEGDNQMFIGKISCLYFTMIIVLMLVVLSNELKIPLLYGAAFIYLTTPMCFYYAFKCHIDPVRMMLFLAAMYASTLFIKTQTLRFSIPLGILCGLSWFFHSTGIITILIAGFITNLFIIKKWDKVAVHSLICLGAIMVIVVFDLIAIYQQMGRIIGDTENILIISALENEHDFFWGLDRGLDSVGDRIITVFRGFYEWKFFGISYWLGLIGVTLLLRRTSFSDVKSFSDAQYLSLCMLIVFYSLIIITVALGMKAFIFNPRYILQPQPLIALLAAYGIGKFIAGKHEKI